jgi:hypothetical protein
MIPSINHSGMHFPKHSKASVNRDGSGIARCEHWVTLRLVHKDPHDLTVLSY